MTQVWVLPEVTMAQQFPLTATESLHLESLRSRGALHLVLVAMRPHQWVKNLFVFAPLLFGMKLGEPSSVLRASAATLCFCLLSSGMYLVNDICDAEADRAHPEKRLRPIASGALSRPLAILSSLLLLAAAFALAFIMEVTFGLLAFTYCVVTLGYCLAFKQAIVLDGMLIATGFVLRVVGGAIAIDVVASHWLIVCAFLLALFLAFSKRRQELLMLSTDAAQHRRVLGQYTVTYLDRANSIVLGATIVCYALYTVAPETVQRFGTDKLIYGSVFVIYGLLRYMALLQGEENGGNPSKMLIKDKPILIAVTGWAIYNALIIYRSSFHVF
jgi:4-hydroxybenzoate polyprenyltransferase